jgi:tetratricopeptide (TPR) repeat protein
MQDYAGAEKQARKILELDPKSQSAAEQLQQALLLQERKTEQLQAAQTLAETTPSARNCFLLSKALVLNQRYDLAEQTCLAGLKLEANDVYCLLGVAALAMRKGDDAPSMKLAQDSLDKARRELRPESGMNLFVEFDYLTAIHQALTGEAPIARLKLERMHAEYPDSTRYEKALIAIGR